MVIKFKPLPCYHCGKLINNPIEYVKKPLPLNTKGGIKMVDRDLHSDCAKDLAERIHYEIDAEREYDDFHKAYMLFKEWYGLEPENKKDKLDKYTIMRLKGLRIGEFFSTGQNVQYLKRGYDPDVIYKTMLFISDRVESVLRGKMRDKNRREQTNYIIGMILNNINRIQERINAQKRAEKALEKVVVEEYDETKSVYVRKHTESNVQKAYEIHQEIAKQSREDEIDLTDIF